jgi:hypothetical protein
MLPQMSLLDCWVVAQLVLEDKTKAFRQTQGRYEASETLLRRLVLQHRSLFQRRETSTHPIKGEDR